LLLLGWLCIKINLFDNVVEIVPIEKRKIVPYQQPTLTGQPPPPFFI
jgi:hypothetical protein